LGSEADVPSALAAALSRLSWPELSPKVCVMKTNLKKVYRGLVLAGLGVLALSQALTAGELTAFQLVKEGNRHLGEEAKDRVVQIRSEKSVGTLTPNIWWVVYYDPDATAMATEIKFMAGKKESVKRPARVLEPITGAHKELPKDKLKIDSDKAIDIAKAEPLLKNLTLTNTQLKLEKWGDDNLPVWKVRLWAQKVRKPTDTADIGEVIISAVDGKVVKNELKINRAD
jgi:hypothetical protein